MMRGRELSSPCLTFYLRHVQSWGSSRKHRWMIMMMMMMMFLFALIVAFLGHPSTTTAAADCGEDFTDDNFSNSLFNDLGFEFLFLRLLRFLFFMLLFL